MKLVPLFISLLCLSFSNPLYADSSDKSVSPTDAILFIRPQPSPVVIKNLVQPYSSIMLSSNSYEPMTDSASKESYIPVDKIVEFIKGVRSTICCATGDSDVKVWISADASGKLLGIGTSAQSGIEVTFHCK